MKNSNYRFTVLATFSFIACACLFTMSTWGQVKVENQKQNPNPQPIKIGKDGVGGNRPEMRIGDKVALLMSKVEALEAENKEIKQQMFAAKLLLSGLDKAFASHTHRLQLSAGKLALSCDASVGNCTVKPMVDGTHLYIPNGTPNISQKLFTTPPVK
jgi:hypothetical protein